LFWTVITAVGCQERIFNRCGIRASGAFNNGGGRHFDFLIVFVDWYHCNFYLTAGVMSSNEASHFCPRPGGSVRDREILHGINFEVKARETMVFLGIGSGKSTLLRTMVGLEKTEFRQRLVGGTNLLTLGRRMDAVRKRIGLSFQGAH